MGEEDRYVGEEVFSYGYILDHEDSLEEDDDYDMLYHSRLRNNIVLPKGKIFLS